MDRVQPGCVNWKKVNKKKMNRYKRLENMNYAIDIGKELGFSLVGIGGVDIVDKNEKYILGEFAHAQLLSRELTVHFSLQLSHGSSCATM